MPWLLCSFLSHNKLQGQIPKELSKLRHLARLWLDDNQLTGVIPTTELAILAANGEPHESGSRTSLRDLYQFTCFIIFADYPPDEALTSCLH